MPKLTGQLMTVPAEDDWSPFGFTYPGVVVRPTVAVFVTVVPQSLAPFGALRVAVQVRVAPTARSVVTAGGTSVAPGSVTLIDPKGTG